MVLFTHQASDLFNYDQTACADQILLAGPDAKTKVEYDEYVVYRKSQTEIADDASNHDEAHVTHRFSQDETSGATMLDLAFRQNHTLNRAVLHPDPLAGCYVYKILTCSVRATSNMRLRKTQS